MFIKRLYNTKLFVEAIFKTEAKFQLILAL